MPRRGIDEDLVFDIAIAAGNAISRAEVEIMPRSCCSFSSAQPSSERYAGTARQNELAALWPQQGPSLSIQYAINDLRAETDHKKDVKLKDLMDSIGILESQGIAVTEEKRTQYAQRIYNGACTMEKLVASLFLFSKLELGRIEFHTEPVDLAAYFADYAAEEGPDLAERGLVLSLDSAPASLCAAIDRNAFGRVVENIVGNAIKYKDAETARSTSVSVPIQSSCISLLPITVPVYQRVLCRGFLKHFTVPTRPGPTRLKAAAWDWPLPNRSSKDWAATSQPKERLSAALPSASACRSGKEIIMKRILIIEDHQEIAELERDYLEASDFTVDIASDGDSGLAKALADDYALILLDIMLPGRDGFAICREIRQKKEVPILMVSTRGASYRFYKE